MFEIDIEHCPQSGGTLKIIAAIEHPSVTTKIHRFARPSTAPSSGQGLRSIRTGLIPRPSRSHPVQPLSRPSPWPSLARDVKTLRNIAPRAEERPDNASISGRGPYA